MHVCFLSTDCSLFVFALLKHLLHPRITIDNLITTVCPRSGRVARRDAVKASACRTHALPIACTGLVELHGRAVLQADKKFT